MPKISVFIPACNEEKNLPILFEKVDKVFKRNKIDGEIIFVNDGSTDNTGKLAEQLKQKYPYLRVFHHKRNLGLSEAFMTAFKNIKGEEIVFIPSDLQSNPEEDIPKLLNKLNQGYDLVTGWRAQWNRPKSKILQSKVYSYLSRKLFNIKIHDFNWVRAFKRYVIENMYLRKDWHRYFVVMVANKGYKIGEVKVTEYPRGKGSSKFNISRIFTGFLDLFVLKFYLSFTEKPILLFTIPGLIFFTSGILIGTYSFFLWLFYNIGDRIMLYFLTVMLLFVGIQLFALGIIAEFLAIIREEVNRRK